uniref:Uncharacterized protein n=1 Tax=Panagrolaimus davidi TaxID=227884 RepID=A0A914PGS7_9BILA
MAYLPNIEVLLLNNVKITEKTPHALTSMKFYSKFERVYIYLISGEEFDTEEFSKFLIINKIDEPDQSFYCGFTFCKEFDADFVRSFKKFLKKYGTVEVDVDSDEEESGDELETDSNDSD